MKVNSESEVAQSCPILSDPTDYSLPGSSVHGIFQARVLEWVPLPSPVGKLLNRGLSLIEQILMKSPWNCVVQHICLSTLS